MDAPRNLAFPNAINHVGGAVTASRIEPAFVDRTWSLLNPVHKKRCQAFFIIEGGEHPAAR